MIFYNLSAQATWAAGVQQLSRLICCYYLTVTNLRNIIARHLCNKVSWPHAAHAAYWERIFARFCSRYSRALDMSSDSSDLDYEPSPSLDSSQSDSNSDESSSSSDVPLDQNPAQQAASTIQTSNWHHWNGSRQKQFPLQIQPGIDIPNNCETELDVYKLFVDKDVITSMVQMTNSYANKTKLLTVMTRHMRLNKWTDCTEEEIIKLFGLLVYMGLKKLPQIRDYWSKKNYMRTKLLLR